MLPEIVLISLLIIVTVLYILERAKIHDSKSQDLNLIHQANQKAQDIIGNAELESIKLVADSRFTSQKAFNEQFATMTDKLEADFKAYLANLETSSQESQVQITEATKQRVNQMLENFEQTLSTMISQTGERSTTSIELEIRSARQLIETYKHQQLTLIDENIIAMLEQTLSLVLAKKLSLKDQTDLVYEALQKAKLEKFIV